MNETYVVEEKKLSKLLDIIDGFKEKMDKFNNKFGNQYTYGIDMYSEDDKTSEGKIHTALINVKHNGTIRTEPFD
jgi:hypothetical protein